MPIYSKPSTLPQWSSSQTEITQWAISTAYSLDQEVTNGARVYRCTTAGTSASSGSGPTGTSSTITDGTAAWDYRGMAANYQAPVEPYSSLKTGGFKVGAPHPSSFTNWLFYTLYLWARYLNSLTQYAFTWTGVHAFGQTLSATNPAGTAWANTTTYSVDDIRTNDSGKIYICTTAGTSAGSGGPTGTGSAITDNTVVWKYLRSAAPAILGTSSVSGQPGVKGAGDGTGAAPGLSTADVLQFDNLASDPASPAEGQVWYNSTSHTWKGRKNGSTVTFTTS